MSTNNVLVVAEHLDGQLKRISLECMTAAADIAASTDGHVQALVLGSAMPGTLAEQLGQAGARTVFVADDGSLHDYAPVRYAQIVADTVRHATPAVVLFGATARGRDLSPRVAAKLGVGLASDCTGFAMNDGRLIITRPIYAGKAIAQVMLQSTPQMATVRPNIFPPAEAAPGRQATVETIAVGEVEAHAVVEKFEAKGGDRIELTEANIIVSGGRGMGGPENYMVIEALADELGAAVGASRAAVDAGWRPHSDQVGQTGKTVSPSLYIAGGISGAIQHLAGMRTSKVIVAINKDPDAPIFKVADYGIVGDLFDVVPALREAVHDLKA
jgi:electron transfer flavoprotein alpha subunit